jgi:hypothetical protein
MKKEILFSLLGMMMFSGYAKANPAKPANSGHAATAGHTKTSHEEDHKNKKGKGASGHDAQKGSKHH